MVFKKGELIEFKLGASWVVARFGEVMDGDRSVCTVRDKTGMKWHSYLRNVRSVDNDPNRMFKRQKG